MFPGQILSKGFVFPIRLLAKRASNQCELSTNHHFTVDVIWKIRLGVYPEVLRCITLA